MNSGHRFSFVMLIAAAAIAGSVQPAMSQLYWNQAATFQGTTTSFVAVPNSASLNITGNFTLECWVRTTQTGATLISKNGYRLMIDAGKMRMQVNNSTRAYSKSTINTGSWNHIAVSYNASGSQCSFYINGALDTTANTSLSAPATGTDTLFIGKDSPYQGAFAGNMDEVRVWDRALTSTEISANFRLSLQASTGIYSGLVLALTFQDYLGNAGFLDVSDKSGMNNNGTATNVALLDLGNRPSTTIVDNSSLSLHGTGAYAVMPNQANISPSPSFTVEAWVNPDNIAATDQVIISKYTGSSGFIVALLSTGRIALTLDGNIGSTSVTIPSRAWTHVAVTCLNNGTSVIGSLYVNGTRYGFFSYNSYTANTDSLYIGCRGGTSAFFTGYIDEVRISSYAKTQQQVNDFMYRSINSVNRPNTSAVEAIYNLDGSAHSSTVALPVMQFRGPAAFTTVGSYLNTPVSPMVRADNLNFPAGWFMKQSSRRVPSTGTAGQMIDDSLTVSQNSTINDINLFVAMNHSYDTDVRISLVAPNGDSVIVFDRLRSLARYVGVTTIFDDQADSAGVTDEFVTFSPRIKPSQSMTGAFSGRSTQGVWRLRIADLASGDTGRVYAWGIQFNNQVLVGVKEIASTLPQEFRLDQNYPNPFNPSTTIRFSVPSSEHVTLKVYNILGQEVATLVNEARNAGTYKVTFDASALASGAYFCRLTAGERTQTQKMMLLK